jgi:hypothetical protein
VSSLAPGITTAHPSRTVSGTDLWSAVRSAPWQRKLQVALGFIWLIDAALQYQPFMFSRSFVTQALEPAAAGNMWIVEHPALWADHFMIHHITLYNTFFATIQLVIALALFFRPTVKAALAVSIVWSFGIWWLAEGIGGVTNGAAPIMGAPGAVIIYALIAFLVWPRDGVEAADGLSVAQTGQLGRTAPQVLWAILWGSFVALGLEAANRAPSALHDAVVGMGAGEPGWIKALDRGLASPLAHHGTEVSILLSVLFAVTALGIFHPATIKVTVGLAVVLGVAIWLAEDFGEIFTASATDVNSGPLLVLLAACFWPLRPGVAQGRSTAKNA